MRVVEEAKHQAEQIADNFYKDSPTMAFVEAVWLRFKIEKFATTAKTVDILRQEIHLLFS